ncbi:tachykinin-3b [Siniperca chuatsi]|uniref:tachykinin-3b n=1 Tax=Siniperca chuatsi TaxID=119488 RepID=UPI001CE08286|nr:tachykinin-3b [Siniperca chuatsi]XP_044033422.1 tachykinin-3b [Siniperca chuatsi]
MERTPNCCTLASLAALVILVLLPVRCWCKEDAYKSLTQANKPECCVSRDAELKRFDDIDYDSFVSLMGRRSAAQPNSHRNTAMSRKRDMDPILAALMLRRTRMACPCAKEYSQTRRG